MIKQDFERMSSELGKKIKKLEEEKMFLKLDVDAQKSKWQQEVQEEKAKADYWERKFREMQVINEALEKNLAENLNEKGELQARVTELGRSLHHHRSRNSVIELKASLNKIEEMKVRIEELESVLHSCELRIECLETRERHLKEELHRLHGQVRNRDHLIEVAIVQIQEVADHLQTLAAQADVLSIKYELQESLISLNYRRERENLEAEHPYGTRAKSKKMDQRMEQFQREMQDQMQEQMPKLQQEMRDQMLEAQKNMMAQMSQMMSGIIEKAKGPIVNTEDNEDPPRLFTPTHMQAQHEEYPRRPPVTIRLQQGQADTEMPMNFQVGIGSNLGDNLANPVVPDFDMAEGEGIKTKSGIDAKDLTLVPDLVLPHKFKMPKFEKYNRTTCPEAHITMFCRRMAGYMNNDQLLIHCFQDSLTGSASRWYNQLSRTNISSLRDLAQAFMRQYNHVTDMTPDRIMLQNMEKRANESFGQYAQRWREIAKQVQPPLLEKETTMLFINTLKEPFITHMIGNTTKSFTDIVMAGEMIENAIRGGKIKAGETTKRPALRKKESEVNNASTFKGYSKVVTINQPKIVTAGQQGLTRQESGPKQNAEKIQFTPIPMTYKELYHTLLEERMVSPFYLQPIQPCILNECARFRALIQSLMENKELEFYEEGSEGGHIHATEEESTSQKANYPKIITSRSRNVEGGAQIKPEVIIHRPVSFPYKDNKMVPWTYNCNIVTPGIKISANTSKEVQREGSYTRSGRHNDSGNARTEPAKAKDVLIEPKEGLDNLINVPVREQEAKEFLKFLKHNEYSVVEQLRKQPARISVLALLLSSEVHREALMKVLNETYVTKDISVNKLDRLVSNISADNFISFSDDEIPPGDSSHMKASQNIVRAFDGIERRVMRRIDIPLQIGPNTYEVDFLIMDIKPSYNCLLGRPWIHSAGAVPSSLHQKLKLVTDGRLVTINAEEDIIATVTNDAPYVETNEEAIECLFCSLEFVNATFISEGSKVPVPKMSKTTRMGLQMMVGKGALPGKGLGIIHPEKGLLESPHINAIHEEESEQRSLLGIRPYEPGSVLDNWTAEELPESRDFEGDRDCDLSPDLLRMVKQEEKQILPHEEEIEDITLEEGKVVKSGTRIAKETRQDLIELLREFKDVFAWLYQDMPGLSTNVVGTFCYKVMPFELKNARATYQRAMVTLFHDMMHKEIEQSVLSELDLESCWVLWSVRKELKLTQARSKRYKNYLRRALRKKSKDGECQKAFDKVKIYLSNAPVLSPPNPDKPLILYLSVFNNSMGCVLGQHDETGRKERAIYYLSKKFTDCEMRYSSIEKLCCALIWTTRRLRQYMLYHTTWLISKLDPLKYMMESTALNGRMARWQILLSEFDIVYVSQKAIKGSAVADFLASRALEEYEPLSFDFPNEGLMYVANTEDCRWKLNFDGASNAMGNGIGVVLVSPSGDYYPFTCRLDFDCTNNMAEYEACIMGLRATLEHKTRVLEVYGDSALEFDDINFNYLPRDENQMADALGTLASMIKVNRPEDMRPIQMSIVEVPAHCYDIEEEERDDHPWYQNVLRYVKNREYPENAAENEKRTLRRMASDYVLDGDILYKKRKDQVLLRCVDAVEAKQILEEVHESVFGTHANRFTMARQIMRFGYYWSTMEGDCISYAKKCHKCQIYGDKIHVPPSPLHIMTSPWPFSMWRMDVIGPISPKASNGHWFIFVVIDYFMKWVEAASYANVTKSAVSQFLKKEIICRYGMPERIISDNALNLNNNSIAEICSQFGIKHHNSSPYRPKMNGAVEAANKNIKKIVGKMTETYKDWHEKLPFALYAYRTSVRTSTGATPYSLVYGMEVVLPIEVEIPSLRVLSEIKLDEAEWIQARYDQLNLFEEKRLRAIRHVRCTRNE
ncbi:RNA-directed DNA polymerase (Reverse transcriptase), Ribonuclease H [Gossypium australe]|uniref:RNA-directed DNA polymerase (Reverse transcriptase), Ribonuclease H n=1 Tax=Gossypium australe TaxID=47621 RepID=A0A5B6VXY6_9ROSI|nr:RNA-directed DNA polymerase (Reverse transcriptase), Ribonuclease H [Gossypium australe]